MMPALTNRRLSLVLVALTFACATESGELPSDVPMASLHAADDPPQFSDWSAPVNLGPMANSDQGDMNAAISKDGLSLYFARGAATGGFDIWVSRRAGVDDPWGSAQDLGSTVNSLAGENQPALSPDEHRMFLNSSRPDGFGGQDLYVSRRRDKRNNFGWGTPVNLGSVVNTSANEIAALLFQDAVTGAITLYFASNRLGGPGGIDIYASTMLPDETFGSPVLVEELSTSSDDAPADIRRDGLEMFIASSRPGTLGGMDLWVSVRASTADPWSLPLNLGAAVNTTFNEGGATVSRDGTTLYFHSNSNRPGAIGPCFGDLGPCFFDNYVTTRSKLQGSN